MRHVIGRVPAFLLITTLMLPACAAPREWRGTVRDSAGITIVENTPDPLLVTGDRPTIGEPTVVMETDGQVLDAVFDPSGGILVLTDDPRRVHVLAGDGRPPRTMPADTSLSAGILWMAAPADTVLLADLIGRSVVRFTTDGRPVTSLPIDFVDAVPLSWRTAPGGRLIEHARWFSPPSTDDPSREYIRVRNAGGHVVDTLVALPELSARMLGIDGITSIRFYEPTHLFGVLPDGRLLTAETPSYRITVRAPDGTPERIVTLPVELDSLDAEAQDRLRARVRAHYESRYFTAAAILSVVNGVRFPARRPAIAALHGGPAGTIWVQRPASVDELTAQERRFDPRRTGGSEWDVFDAGGRWLGPVRFPESFRATAWQGSTVLGIIATGAGDRVVRLEVGEPASAG